MPRVTFYLKGLVVLNSTTDDDKTISSSEFVYLKLYSIIFILTNIKFLQR